MNDFMNPDAFIYIRTDTMITISNLQKRFGENTAIDIQSLTVNDGDILGLVGNNGAGKTTLFRLMLDLIKADEGTVTLNIKPDQESTEQCQSINISQSEEWKKYVSAYIDEGFLIDFLTPEEYFHFLGKISGIAQDDIDEKLKDFEHFANGEIFGHKKLIRNLSAGNKQKIGIISAFLCTPKIVILDEPFNFLDPTSQNDLKKIIAEYNGTTGGTVIISSHNLAHTTDISSRIVLLEHGKIIRDLPNNDGAASLELNSYFCTE